MLEWDILNYLKKWRTNLRATAYIETWRYIQVRIGYWKAKIYRPKVKEIIDGAFGRWRKAGRLDY